MSDDRRTLSQNAMFHAICQRLSRNKQWAGLWIDTTGWKRLLTDSWARHENRVQTRVVPSLDGQSIVNLGLQTRRLSKPDFASLIDFAEWYCSENGIDTTPGPVQ